MTDLVLDEIDTFRPRDCARSHNDHCLLTFHGHSWRITAMSGLAWVTVSRLDRPDISTVLDLSQVDWPMYQKMAAALMAEQIDVSNADLPISS